MEFAKTEPVTARMDSLESTVNILLVLTNAAIMVFAIKEFANALMASKVQTALKKLVPKTVLEEELVVDLQISNVLAIEDSKVLIVPKPIAPINVIQTNIAILMLFLQNVIAN